MSLSLTACSSAADDEDEAIAGLVSQGSSDTTDDTDANENKDPVSNDTADKTPPENEKPLEDTKNPEGTTPYAQANGALLAQATSSSPESGWWWLRTKNSEFGAVFCESDGLFRKIGYVVTTKNVGVRPCIWVDLEKLK